MNGTKAHNFQLIALHMQKIEHHLLYIHNSLINSDMYKFPRFLGVLNAPNIDLCSQPDHLLWNISVIRFCLESFLFGQKSLQYNFAELRYGP